MEKKGFTLVEMLMVVVMFSMIGGGVAACFISGSKAWQRAQTMNLKQGDVYLTLESMARELRQIVNTSLVSLEGNNQRVSFATFFHGEYYRIDYRFDIAQKFLMKTTQTLEVISNQQESFVGEKKSLAIENFSFEYLYFDLEKEKYVWIDKWDEDDGVFSALRLKAKENGEVFEKVVYIPIALNRLCEEQCDEAILDGT